MTLLIQDATIINSASKHHLKKRDILIEKGIIKQIGSKITNDKAQKISGKNLMISAGWTDLYAVIREPGNEHKDNIKGLCSSAAQGGFTQVLAISGSNPPLSTRSQIEFIKNASKEYLVNILPTGTITEKLAGENITELYDLHQAGALGFSDGKNSIKNPELLKRALLYVKPFGGTIMVYCEDQNLAKGGMINEGKVAATLGMKVRPALAEEIELERNLSLAEYTDSKIHIHAISTAKSVDLIKKAKARGIKVTCDVHAANLLFTDEDTAEFETVYKVLPVLRTKEDTTALIKGLKSGVIDAISSGHTPQDLESKECEFDHAEFGMITLECMAAALHQKLNKHFTAEELTILLAENSRKTLGLPIPKIDEGEPAELTVFQSEDWTYDKKNSPSIAKNSPFYNHKFNLKVVGIIKGQSSILH